MRLHRQIASRLTKNIYSPFAIHVCQPCIRIRSDLILKAQVGIIQDNITVIRMLFNPLLDCFFLGQNPDRGCLN